ncbi:MAG TPA: PASTA domain-containing protein, partial [Steroidobacteraceae bacterium]|nr:PASTA domain-containing protein [Steroidobacteraceae bacterium]
GSILLALLTSDTLNADLVGWSYPVVPGSWQTPTAPGTLTVPSGVVLGAGSSPAPVRQADGTILVGAETSTNQQVLFALQGDAALGFTVAAPAASCGTGAGVAVPNVVNDTQSAATVALTSAGLTLGTVTQQPSSTIASGYVISESPTEGTIVASGTAVSLVISTGSGSGGSSGGGGYGGGGSLDWLLLSTLFGAWLTLTRCQKTRARLPQEPRADVRSGNSGGRASSVASADPRSSLRNGHRTRSWRRPAVTVATSSRPTTSGKPSAASSGVADSAGRSAPPHGAVGIRRQGDPGLAGVPSVQRQDTARTHESLRVMKQPGY